jgi:PASTA domain-containing protein
LLHRGRERIESRRDQRSGRAPARPVVIVVGALAVAAGIGLAVAHGDGPAPLLRAPFPPAGLSTTATVKIDVPDLSGMPASEAREALVLAGLAFATVEPAVGTPGVVLRTRPSIGRRVPPETSVTLVVGVELHRLSSLPRAGPN